MHAFNMFLWYHVIASQSIPCTGHWLPLIGNLSHWRKEEYGCQPDFTNLRTYQGVDVLKESTTFHYITFIQSPSILEPMFCVVVDVTGEAVDIHHACFHFEGTQGVITQELRRQKKSPPRQGTRGQEVTSDVYL